eukprot:COSAG06_NODE_276_length_18571_cov_4.278421_10_plen_92_part_00
MSDMYACLVSLSLSLSLCVCVCVCVCDDVRCSGTVECGGAGELWKTPERLFTDLGDGQGLVQHVVAAVQVRFVSRELAAHLFVDNCCCYQH